MMIVVFFIVCCLAQEITAANAPIEIDVYEEDLGKRILFIENYFSIFNDKSFGESKEILKLR